MIYYTLVIEYIFKHWLANEYSEFYRSVVVCKRDV